MYVTNNIKNLYDEEIFFILEWFTAYVLSNTNTLEILLFVGVVDDDPKEMSHVELIKFNFNTVTTDKLLLEKDVTILLSSWQIPGYRLRYIWYSMLIRAATLHSFPVLILGWKFTCHVSCPGCLDIFPVWRIFGIYFFMIKIDNIKIDIPTNKLSLFVFFFLYSSLCEFLYSELLKW